ncbi:MarR family winged helix-turn-helix transcriptional regulator [Amycolatopsis sp.]|uniref:MarR family winged helix-turn-helix transcriptional regulator n=1 Tax=Amycolatopsis sp. TaxID=37632 RepID=UPI002C09E862|nr:MarR family transcriptional regulator [Amycolatopsis sp.]HVV14679.1 MarR family transcriptional regulator [Amycolatopsis sp.]
MGEDLERLAVALDDLVTAFVPWARARRADLSPTAAAVLNTLGREGPARVVDLAAAVGVTQQSMTTLAAQLRAQGLIRREPDPSDGRAVLITATPEGTRLVRRRRADRTGSLTPLLAELSGDELRDLAGALPALTHLTEALRRSRSGSEVSR